MYGHRMSLQLDTLVDPHNKVQELVIYDCYPNGYDGKFEMKFPKDVQFDVLHTPCIVSGFEINPQLLDLVQMNKTILSLLINYDHYFCVFILLLRAEDGKRLCFKRTFSISI